MVKSLSHGLLDLYLVLRKEEIIVKKPVQGAQQGTTSDINEEEDSIFLFQGGFTPLQSFSLCIASCSALFHRLPPATTYKIYALPCCQPFLETEQGLW